MDLRWNPESEPRGTITLLHGVNSLAETWWQIGPALARSGWSVLALDLPGHGDGPRLTRSMSLAQLVDGVLPRLDPQTDVLVGHSLGSPVALEAARRSPGRIRTLVLEDPALHSEPHPEFAELIRGDALRYAQDRAAAETEEKRRNPGWDPRDVEHAVDGVLRAQSDTIAAGIEQADDWRTDDLLEATNLPTLVLLAEPHRSTASGARRERVQDAADRTVELPGGHCLHRDLPEEWLRHVGPFLDRRAALDE